MAEARARNANHTLDSMSIRIVLARRSVCLTFSSQASLKILNATRLTRVLPTKSKSASQLQYNKGKAEKQCTTSSAKRKGKLHRSTCLGSFPAEMNSLAVSLFLQVPTSKQPAQSVFLDKAARQPFPLCIQCPGASLIANGYSSPVRELSTR